MGRTYPQPSVGSAKDKEHLRRVIEERQLVGAANDTRWGVLLDRIRERKDWKPSYRFKCIDGDPSEWDVEWSCHLPYPLMSVEWLDISLLRGAGERSSLLTTVTDERDWILRVLDEARLCYEVCGTIVRVFGYLPKSYDGLEAAG